MSRSVTEGERARLLDALRIGVDRPTAARYAGHAPEDLERAIGRDETLAADVLSAEAVASVAHVGEIAKAAKGGDWRAAGFLLSRLPKAPKRTKCGARARSGEPCRHPRGFRTKHAGFGSCYLHGGRTPNGEKHAAREGAERALEVLGVPVEIDPQQALLRQVWEAYGNVAFLRARVRELEAIHGPDHLGDERPHVLLALYNEERDRLAKIAKLAIDAGIAERAITIAEAQADAIVSVVTAVLDSLDLPRGKRDAAQAVAVRRLQELGEADLVLGSRN